MADFALILAAVDQILGTDGLTRFAERARTMAEDTLSADPFIAAMDEAQIDFHGKAADLLIKVTPDEQGWRPPRNWPKDPRMVTSLLRRNAPAMRKLGWVVDEGEDRSNHYVIWTVIHPEIGRKSGPQGPYGPQTATCGCGNPLTGSAIKATWHLRKLLAARTRRRRGGVSMTIAVNVPTSSPPHFLRGPTEDQLVFVPGCCWDLES
jgi:hypothetical protein